MNAEKEKRAIEYLRTFEPQTEPYYLCYSGGKDSDCVRILAALAGVKHEIWHNHTTADAPETVYYVRSIPGIHISYPERTMWQLIVDEMFPPTRQARYCCAKLKERGGRGRVKITGVRWAESKNRRDNAGLVRINGKPKKSAKTAADAGAKFMISPKENGIIMNNDNAETRKVVEMCYQTTSTTINPIVDWTDADVWEFLHHYGCASNPLYQCGRKRIGCIGCPLQSDAGMKRDFQEYPKYRQMYVHAFDRMIAAREAAGRIKPKEIEWSDGEHVMRWWVGDDARQINIFDAEATDYG